jgi:membrane fusion protein, multidrug efflux system
MAQTEINPTTPEDDRKPVLEPSRARRMYTIIGIAVLVIVGAWIIFEMVTAGRESTDDAQVAADVVAVASRVPGQIAMVAVKDNQRVKRGDVIVQIDPRDLEVKLAQAQSDLDTSMAQAKAAAARLQIARATARGGLTAATAAVESTRERVDSSSSAISEARAGIARAEANAKKAAADWSRAQELGAKGDISRSQVDAARAAHDAADADLDSARARLSSAENNRQLAQADVQQAQGRLQQTSPVQAQILAAQADADLAAAKVKSSEAALHAAQLNLSYTKIVAPADGIASRLMVHAGSLVSAGQPLVQLVPLQTYVIANFKETQVKAMKEGQHATIKLDATGGKEFEGTLESLSGGTGGTFSLLPPDNASGNFVKVVQRVPVRVKWNGPASDAIPVGASAEVTIETK